MAAAIWERKSAAVRHPALSSRALSSHWQEERASHQQQLPHQMGTLSQAGRKCSLKIPYVSASLLRIEEIKDWQINLPFYCCRMLTLQVIFPCSAQLSSREIPKEEESKSHTGTHFKILDASKIPRKRHAKRWGAAKHKLWSPAGFPFSHIPKL